MIISLGMLTEKCNFLDTLPAFIISNTLVYWLGDSKEGKMLTIIARVLDTPQLLIDLKDVYNVGFKWVSTFNFFTLGNLIGKLLLAVGRLKVVI